MDKKIISPCISICRTDPRTGYCYGCARTNEEKKIWKYEQTTMSWKKGNLNILLKGCTFKRKGILSGFKRLIISSGAGNIGTKYPQGNLALPVPLHFYLSVTYDNVHEVQIYLTKKDLLKIFYHLKYVQKKNYF